MIPQIATPIEISHNNARSNTDGSSTAINYATGDTGRCCNMHNAFLSQPYQQLATGMRQLES